MVILAEIADKMPSTGGIVIACLIAAGVAVGLAWAHRMIAWTVLLLTLVIGGFFAVGGYHESFLETSFSNAIWRELGWPWVAATIAGPFLPAIAVAAVLILRRWQSRGRDSPDQYQLQTGYPQLSRTASAGRRGLPGGEISRGDTVEIR